MLTQQLVSQTVIRKI